VSLSPDRTVPLGVAVDAPLSTGLTIGSPTTGTVVTVTAARPSSPDDG